MNELDTGIRVGIGAVYMIYTISNLAYASLQDEQKARALETFKYPLMLMGILLFLPMIYPFGPMFIVVVALGAEKAPFFIFVTGLLIIYSHIGSFLIIICRDRNLQQQLLREELMIVNAFNEDQFNPVPVYINAGMPFKPEDFYEVRSNGEPLIPLDELLKNNRHLTVNKRNLLTNNRFSRKYNELLRKYRLT
jgi:hypothetical protein